MMRLWYGAVAFFVWLGVTYWFNKLEPNCFSVDTFILSMAIVVAGAMAGGG